MFERARYREVLAMLEALDGERLEASGFLFAGGTGIVPDLDEFREPTPGESVTHLHLRV